MKVSENEPSSSSLSMRSGISSSFSSNSTQHTFHTTMYIAFNHVTKWHGVRVTDIVRCFFSYTAFGFRTYFVLFATSHKLAASHFLSRSWSSLYPLNPVNTFHSQVKIWLLLRKDDSSIKIKTSCSNYNWLIGELFSIHIGTPKWSDLSLHFRTVHTAHVRAL